MELDLALLAGDDESRFAFELAVDDGLVLHHQARRSSLRINFDRARENAGADPLQKAIGKRAKTVLDATAGWCVDAAHLARCGFTVTAVERNAIVAAMLNAAHAACKNRALKRNLCIVHADSVAYLRAQKTPPDVVYIDPMYPPQSKSAAAKKPLALLRMLVEPADDNAELFAEAMSIARQRVIIKRPPKAQPMQPGKVGEVTGKLVRFDIYKPTATESI